MVAANGGGHRGAEAARRGRSHPPPPPRPRVPDSPAPGTNGGETSYRRGGEPAAVLHDERVLVAEPRRTGDRSSHGPSARAAARTRASKSLASSAAFSRGRRSSRRRRASSSSASQDSTDRLRESRRPNSATTCPFRNAFTGRDAADPVVEREALVRIGVDLREWLDARREVASSRNGRARGTARTTPPRVDDDRLAVRAIDHLELRRSRSVYVDGATVARRGAFRDGLEAAADLVDVGAEILDVRQRGERTRGRRCARRRAVSWRQRMVPALVVARLRR